MENDHQSRESSEVFDISVTSGENVSDSFEHSDQNRHEFLSGVEHFLFFLVLLVNGDDFGSNEKLNDHGSGDDRSDSEFHEGSSVGSHDESGPEHWVVAHDMGDSEEWDLGADEEDEEGQ